MFDQFSDPMHLQGENKKKYPHITEYLYLLEYFLNN